MKTHVKLQIELVIKLFSYFNILEINYLRKKLTELNFPTWWRRLTMQIKIFNFKSLFQNIHYLGG